MDVEEKAEGRLTPVFKQRALTESRKRAEARRLLSALFEPTAVAVVGASEREGSVGAAVLDNLIRGGFRGAIYPVNPKYDAMRGLRCYPDLATIPDPVQLAVIAVPAAGVKAVVEQGVARGVGASVVISAGFREVGPEGAVLEAEVAKTARDGGMSLLGPNCLGLINTDPAFSLNASFARTEAMPGHIAFMSQSGALCTSILDYAKGNRIGFSKFVSFGNKAEVDEIDLMRFLADDPQTRAILMYLEDVSDGNQFIQVAREITGRTDNAKPILAIKTGRTEAGARAAASHTGSMAGTDAVYDAIMAQAGVLRVDSVQELFDYAMAFGSQPLPASNRVAIVTNAGGPGIMATDACVRYGLAMADLAEETRAAIKRALPDAASVANPVDLIGDARHDRYQAALEGVLGDPNTDGVIVILTPQTMTDIEEIAEIVANAAQGSPKPVLASFMGLVDVSPGVAILRQRGVPHYPFPEGAARVLGAMHAYATWLSRPRTHERVFDVDRSRAHRILEQAMAEGRTALADFEALGILDAYGLPTVGSKIGRNRDEAVALCAGVGYPAVMKIASHDILHKSDVGGVVVGIEDAEAAGKAYDGILARARAAFPDARIEGVSVQATAPRGREVIMGMTRDAKFGPIMMFGLGGIYTEALQDVTFRLAPLRELSARRMVASIKGHRILEGIRGDGPADFAAMQECLERLSQLVVEFPSIVEMDVNPLIVYEEGARAVDARIILRSGDGEGA